MLAFHPTILFCSVNMFVFVAAQTIVLFFIVLFYAMQGTD